MTGLIYGVDNFFFKASNRKVKKHNAKDFYLEGGNEQIYMTPGTLDKQPLTPQLTNWPEI